MPIDETAPVGNMKNPFSKHKVGVPIGDLLPDFRDRKLPPVVVQNRQEIVFPPKPIVVVDMKISLEEYLEFKAWKERFNAQSHAEE